jgi:hypothetical protein
LIIEIFEWSGDFFPSLVDWWEDGRKGGKDKTGRTEEEEEKKKEEKK